MTKIWQRFLDHLFTLSVISGLTGNMASALNCHELSHIDHRYRELNEMLQEHVKGTHVTYSTLLKNRSLLDRIVNALEKVTVEELSQWNVQEQMTDRINSYNAFTIKTILEHYPLKRNRKYS